MAMTASVMLRNSMLDKGIKRKTNLHYNGTKILFVMSVKVAKNFTIGFSLPKTLL